jgi:PAS domain-containing protein
MELIHPTFHLAVVSNDNLFEAPLKRQLPCAHRCDLHVFSSISEAVFHLEEHAAMYPSAHFMLVVALDELKNEPGNIQYKIARLQESAQLVILGAIARAAALPSFIYSLSIDDTTCYPFIAEELGRRIGLHIKYQMARTCATVIQSVLESVGEALLVLGEDGSIIWANDDALTCLEYSASSPT